MSIRSSFSLFTALVLIFATTACQRDATAPLTPPGEPPTTQLAPALVEVTISGIGSPEPSASVSSAEALALSPSARSGVSYSLSGPVSGGGSGDGSIELEPLTTGSFTQGVRGAGGYRYVWATFRVRNAQTDGTAYDTPRENLTFFAATTGGTLGGSAITSLERFDSSAAAPSIATEILPTGGVSEVNGQLAPNQPDVLQVLSESEAAAVAAPSGVGVLPYGFVVRNATDGGRTIPAGPVVGQYDGMVTFAFKIPLQATAADDPFTIRALFLAEDDSEVRLTQSIEEQTPAGEVAFLARAQAIGATVKTVLPGLGTYLGASSDTRLLCSVRTAGPSAGPAAYLINRTPASVEIRTPLATWPLWAGGSVARDLGAVALDAGGAPMADVPVQFSFGTPGVLTAWGGKGGVRMVPRRDRASTTVTAGACGVTSAPVTLRTSGFSSIATEWDHSVALKAGGDVVAWCDDSKSQLSVPAGLWNVVQVDVGSYHSVTLQADGTVKAWGYAQEDRLNVPSGLSGVVQIAVGGNHSLALKSDGTVVAWGSNYFGETDVPAGLTNVIQVAAGATFSLALKNDGTVAAWGSNTYGQLDIPTGLTNVVQVAAGNTHALALKSDGTVVAWDVDGSRKTSVPTGLSGVVQISAGQIFSLALKSDGTVVAWGDNVFGVTDVPAGLTGVVQVSAGQYIALALKSDGTVVVWGDDDYDQTIIPSGLVAMVP